MASTGGLSSGSDDEVRSNQDETVRKRARRRRGRKTHRRLGLDSPMSENRVSPESSSMREGIRKRTNSVGTPAAPYNTTQFLLQDMQVREQEEEEVEQKRRRSCSVGDIPNRMVNEEECSSSSSDQSSSMLSGGDAEDEFEVDYREAAFQKYTEMNHVELARTMVEVERTRDKVAEELDLERRRNARLHDLIRKRRAEDQQESIDNGIHPSSSPHSSSAVISPRA